MGLNNFSTDGLIITVNGRVINDWGDANPPYSDDPIDPVSTLRRGQGGGAVRLDRINPGRRVTLNLNPGSADSTYMQGLMNSKATIEMSKTQLGSLEAAVGVEGVIINDGSTGRGGSTITDDQYMLEFNIWTGGKGGDT